MSSERSFIVLYRWKLHPGAEAAFAEAWAVATRRLLALGSKGSRLHRGSDGLWYSYAQWPSEEGRQRAFSASSGMDSANREKMCAAIAEELPEIILECVEDHLLPLAPRED